MKEVLDVCCGGKMFWFDKNNKDVLFLDIREGKNLDEHWTMKNFQVQPDTIMDFRKLNLPSESFNLIVFDPPHKKNLTKESITYKKYGGLNEETWKDDISKGFDECWRVLKVGGTLVFKWNEVSFKVKEILDCLKHKPMFGQKTTKNLKSHWLVFYKGE